MKLNKFQHVEIPKKSDFFARMSGNMPVIPSGMYSGDADLPSGGMRKTEILQRVNAEELNRIRAEAAEARNRAQEDGAK